ncbi:SDR family NAD(P)-dependent oxidoreductase [Lentzea tibetensis]|uniref:SDR family NAD(P)-dependent oxidoreductase n=1 Tax=Lentzea tibetensis TaxID=2591470 RepID=A0A563EI53_9PSEU|nr:SDR family NAD(P)-dependent oxidoreductase [Lentzea tibetensis]TWP45996.1 SDR family NAD(P)-dependent oxidoreductase [Lentzea tibetensis]
MSKVWLITGSSRGLGRAIAQAALAAGDRVVATARNPRDVADLVEAHGDRVCPAALDVRDADQARKAVAAGVEAFGRLDVVVNNAGRGLVTSIEDCTDEEFRDQLDTNLWGAIAVTRAALPVLRAQRSGHFVQMGSITGRTAGGSSGFATYVTAKHGLAGFSEALANEVAPFGVKVTLVEAGGFTTDWAAGSLTFAEVREDYAGTVGYYTELIRAAAGRMPGDPARLAAVLMDVVAMDDPPSRLLLGTDALRTARATAQARAETDDRWEHLSRRTDHEIV